MMVRKLLLSCGAISSVLYLVAIDVIVALRHADYHNFTSQMVSELMAVGAPTRNLLIWLFTPYNVLVFAFAAGVWASARGRRSVRLTATALIAYGVMSTAGLFLFPMDMRGTVDSQRDALHIAATFVMSIFIVAVMAFGAFTRGRRFRLYSLATIATVVVFGALAGLLARPMPGPTPGLGLAERINIYATMVWMASLVAALWPQQNGTAIRLKELFPVRGLPGFDVHCAQHDCSGGATCHNHARELWAIHPVRTLGTATGARRSLPGNRRRVGLRRCRSDDRCRPVAIRPALIHALAPDPPRRILLTHQRRRSVVSMC